MNPLFNIKQALSCHQSIVKIRTVEETIVDNYFPKDSEQPMRCPVHLSIGQEAAATAVMENLIASDQVYSTHRSHAHYIARGGNIRKMFAELMGRKSGCVNGRGGSMHLKDLSVNFMMSVPIVGSVIPVAAGAALAKKIKEEEGIVVVFVGDGALEEGTWHEAANFAAIQRLKVLFVCENNLFSVYSHIDDRQPKLPLTRFAAAHGIHSIDSDGNDIEVAYLSAAKAIEFIRNESAPCFLSLDTYRHLEHCGPNFDDHLQYRSKDEVKEWLSRDPYEISSSKLIKEFDFTVSYIEDIYSESKTKAERDFDLALNDSWPDFRDIKDLEYPRRVSQS